MQPDSNKRAATPEHVRPQLARMLRDPLFQRSERLTTLLSYLVERTLAGRASALKEYTIGAEAFQRGPEFNTQLDNVVRVNASRLRSKLAEYYQRSGAQ